MHESLRGQFLVAGRRLRDPNFFRAVVLMVEHGPDGGMGLVVNRPSSVTVAHALSEHFKLPETDDLVYVGGPVEPSALFILHNAPQLDDGDGPVIPDLYVGSSADAFERIVRTAVEDDADLKFRIFSGCAGWGPGQLEGEVCRGDWLQVPAIADALFQDPYDLWDRMIVKSREVNPIAPFRIRGNPDLN